MSRQATIWQTLKAVGWSFFGVRKGKDHEADMARLNPIHVIVAGLFLAAVFVATLIAIANWVV